MDARTGKKIRMGRLFDQVSKKTLIVAYSHGILMGPRPGMRNLAEMRRIGEAVRQANGLMIAPGLLPALEDLFVGKDRPSLIVHFDYQSFSRTILPYREGASVALASVEDVVAAGADVLMTYLYMGYEDPEREKLEIERNAQIARACERWGMLLMIEPRSAREATHKEDKVDPALLGMYCRISAEIGGDFIKCIYPGSTEAFAQVVEGCTAPVLLAGGAKTESPERAYAIAQSAMDAGAAGLVFGRNIYEAPDPAGAVTRLFQIVHQRSAASAAIVRAG